jgi:hypothetical protein
VDDEQALDLTVRLGNGLPPDHLARFVGERTEGLLSNSVRRECEQTVTFVGCGRGAPSAPAGERVRSQRTAVTRTEEAIADLAARLGWRASTPEARVSGERAAGILARVSPRTWLCMPQRSAAVDCASAWETRRSLHQQRATLAGRSMDNPR